MVVDRRNRRPDEPEKRKKGRRRRSNTGRRSGSAKKKRVKSPGKRWERQSWDSKPEKRNFHTVRNRGDGPRNLDSNGAGTLIGKTKIRKGAKGDGGCQDCCSGYSVKREKWSRKATAGLPLQAKTPGKESGGGICALSVNRKKIRKPKRSHQEKLKRPLGISESGGVQVLRKGKKEGRKTKKTKRSEGEDAGSKISSLGGAKGSAQKVRPHR